jgi:hypothetical protein
MSALLEAAIASANEATQGSVEQRNQQVESTTALLDTEFGHEAVEHRDQQVDDMAAQLEAAIVSAHETVQKSAKKRTRLEQQQQQPKKQKAASRTPRPRVQDNSHIDKAKLTKSIARKSRRNTCAVRRSDSRGLRVPPPIQCAYICAHSPEGGGASD